MIRSLVRLGILVALVQLTITVKAETNPRANVRPEEYLQLATFFARQGDTAKAIHYYHEAGELFAHARDLNGQGMVFRGMMYLFFKAHDYNRAVRYGEQAAVIFHQADNRKEELNAWNFLGVRYGDMGYYEKALDADHHALQLAEQCKDSLLIAINLSNIAGYYSGQKESAKSLEYNLRALSFLQTSRDHKAIGYLLNNIGIWYLENRNYALALQYFNRSIEHKKKARDFQGEVFSLNNIGDLYLKSRQPAYALPYLIRSVVLADSISDPLSRGIAYSTLAMYYRTTGNPRRALEYFQKSLALSKTVRLKSEEMNNLKNVAETYEDLMNYPEALFYFQKYSALRDTLFEEQRQKAVAEMNAKYSASVKERKILSLEAQNHVKGALLTRNRALIGSLTTLLLVIVVASVLTIYFYRQRLQAYKKLVKKDMDSLEAETEQARSVIMQPDIPGKLHDRIAAGLADLMMNGKRFLDPELTLADIARELNTNTSYLSRVINSRFSSNFSQFVNEYRVLEARKMLIDSKYRNLTIEGIARSTGFNSKSAFNAAFKKITGVTPSIYQVSARQMQQGKLSDSTPVTGTQGTGYGGGKPGSLLKADRAAP